MLHYDDRSLGENKKYLVTREKGIIKCNADYVSQIFISLKSADPLLGYERFRQKTHSTYLRNRPKVTTKFSA